MRKPFRRVAALATLSALVACATAYAISFEIRPVWVSATVTVQPRELPRTGHGNAPISLNTVTRVGTRDGSTPPTLETLTFLFDKNGTVDTKGLPVCTMAKLEGTTPAQARKKCAGALVGEGEGKALVTMPGKAPFTISTPLSLFNGPPAGGQPTLIAHAYEKVPTAKALLVPIAVERVNMGRYGFRAQVEMPEIAAGFGVPTLAEATINAVRKRGGKKIGFINAHCVGGRLQVYGTARFTNGDFFPVTLTSPCHYPR